MSNILEALVNIVENKDYEIKEYTIGGNRAQNMGEALEEYIFDAFSNSFDIDDDETRRNKHSEVFSFLGAKNKIPDAILKNGDALEVKKATSESSIQLNSSYPKHSLKATDTRIQSSALTCEEIKWEEKEMLYCFGYIPSGAKHLKSVWFVYGRIYCDLQEVYEEIIDDIKANLDDDYTGNELGGAKGVDSLKITTLRVRGMWVIKHPQKVYSKLTKDWGNNDFEVKALIPKSIFDNFPQKSKDKLNASVLNIEEIEVTDPTNRAKTLNCVFIYYK
ncbi:NgoPII family restriction endonuclease [Winogradskyella costae]|uniref:NgoPII family restriction endonuclease n=1 Tax=Winogradskyella costae TaxID=2697008 RepID=UPI0015CB83BE|nr:NgoPII family restriction endonuclease [Winogradskyella costae]